MTATEQLIAKQVSDVFPASVDDLPLADAARRGLIAPLRCLRVPPAAAINSVPIVGGDFEERALAAALDHEALNQAAASLYRDRFGSTPGIVYSAGVEHAYNLAQEFRAAGPEGGGGLGQDAARAARRDARRLRARRDQRPDQRAAARRGLELAPRDRVHAPRADRVPPRLPAADRPHHAHAPAQGGRRRRRLRAEGARRTTSASSRSTPCSTPTSTARAPASRPRRAGASSGAPAASSRRCHGSCPSRPTSPDGSPSSSASGSASTRSTSTRTSSASGRRSPAARSGSTSAPSSPASSPRGGRARSRSSSSSRPAPRRTRTGGCG